VTSYDLGNVSPISTATNKLGRPIVVWGSPVAIAITPNGKTAYVANERPKVVAIQTATNTKLKVIRISANSGAESVEVAVTPDGKTAYVANYGSGTVTPIQIATNTALPPITVGIDPGAIAITPDGQIAYVVNNNGGP
jgi:YVTN family beta-propeller protein